MKREKSTKSMTVVLQPSLYEAFEKRCNEEYRNVSEIIRELMSKYTRSNQMKSMFYDPQVMMSDIVNGVIDENKSIYTLLYIPLDGTLKGNVFITPNPGEKGSHVCSLAGSGLQLNNRFLAMCGSEEKLGCNSTEAVPLSIYLDDNKLTIDWSKSPEKTHVVASYEYEACSTYLGKEGEWAMYERLEKKIKNELEKEYSAKLDEAYAQFQKQHEEDAKVAESGYKQAYEIVSDLHNRLKKKKKR